MLFNICLGNGNIDLTTGRVKIVIQKRGGG